MWALILQKKVKKTIDPDMKVQFALESTLENWMQKRNDLTPSSQHMYMAAPIHSIQTFVSTPRKAVTNTWNNKISAWLMLPFVLQSCIRLFCFCYNLLYYCTYSGIVFIWCVQKIIFDKLFICVTGIMIIYLSFYEFKCIIFHGKVCEKTVICKNSFPYLDGYYTTILYQLHEI